MSNHNDADFFAKWPEDFEDNVWQDDDQSTDVMALVVLGDVPVETINEILRQNTEATSCPLWLADAYDNLPGWTGELVEGTTAPVNPHWRSPFNSLDEAVDFVRDIPKPPKPLCKTFCAVLDRERYERYGELLFVKVDEAEPQVIPCRSSEVATVFEGMDRDVWPDRLAKWREEGISM